MRSFQALRLILCAHGIAASFTGSNQVPLGVSNKDGGQKPITPSRYWYESITHNGEASFMPSSYKPNYRVFRNVVTDYGADNTGNNDASAAIQKAINGVYFPTDSSWSQL